MNKALATIDRTLPLQEPLRLLRSQVLNSVPSENSRRNYAVALIAIWRSVSEGRDVSAESGRAMGSGAVSCEEREMLSLRGKCMILLVNCRHLS